MGERGATWGHASADPWQEPEAHGAHPGTMGTWGSEGPGGAAQWRGREVSLQPILPTLPHAAAKFPAPRAITAPGWCRQPGCPSPALLSRLGGRKDASLQVPTDHPSPNTW